MLRLSMRKQNECVTRVSNLRKNQRPVAYAVSGLRGMSRKMLRLYGVFSMK